MIRFTQLVHGRGTISEVIKHKNCSPHDVPSKFLAFTQTRRPLVFWNITKKCNLSCSHCYIGAGPDRQTKDELSFTEAKVFIDDLAEMKIPLLMFTGGEPLVRRDFWELASYARSKGLKLALSSNGTMINRGNALKIKKVGFEYVGISLDGGKENTHDSIRGQVGSFSRSVMALKNCVEIGVKCGIRITATKDNYREIPSILNLLMELKVPRFCLYWLVPSGRGKELFRNKKLNAAEVTHVLDILYKKAKEFDPEKVEILTVDAPQDGVYLLEKLKGEKSPEHENASELLKSIGDSCSAGDRVANVDSCGNVYVCQFAQLAELKVGNTRQQKFSEIWSDDDNFVLSTFRNKVKDLEGKCGKCPHKKLCGGGCRIRAYFKYHNLWAEDPLCSLV